MADTAGREGSVSVFESTDADSAELHTRASDQAQTDDGVDLQQQVVQLEGASVQAMIELLMNIKSSLHRLEEHFIGFVPNGE